MTLKTKPCSFELIYDDIFIPFPEINFLENSDFSKNSVCLVLANGPYDEKEYVRNKPSFYKIHCKNKIKLNLDFFWKNNFEF
jgi:hypothetical protein